MKDILCLSCLENISINYDNFRGKYLANFNNNQLENFYNTTYLPLEEYYDEEITNTKEVKNNPNYITNENYINSEEILNKLYLIDELDKKSSEANFIMKIVKDIIQKYDFSKYISIKENLSDIKSYSELNEGQNSSYYNETYKYKNESLVDYDYTVPRWPLAIFYIGGMICLGFSATFHLFSAHSKIVKRVFNRMDYGGIAVLIVCSCYPPYYYYFYCNFSKFKFY